MAVLMHCARFQTDHCRDTDWSLVGVRLFVSAMYLRGRLAMSMPALRAASKRDERRDEYTTAQCCKVAAQRGAVTNPLLAADTKSSAAAVLHRGMRHMQQPTPSKGTTRALVARMPRPHL